MQVAAVRNKTRKVNKFLSRQQLILKFQSRSGDLLYLAQKRKTKECNLWKVKSTDNTKTLIC